MQKHLLIALTLFFASHYTGKAQIIYQSIYEIKFGLTKKNNKAYTALVIRNTDGSNAVRIQYKNVTTKKTTSYEIPFFAKADDFMAMAEKIKPTVFYGTDTASCVPIYFSYFSTGRFLDDKKNTLAYKNKKADNVFVATVTALRREDLKQDYVEQFFLHNDDFFIDLFDNNKTSIQSTPWFYYINIANTLDKKIGDGCKKDIKTLAPIFKRIPQELDLPSTEINIADDVFTKQNVLNAIAKINPKKQDIVVFYYTGHGFSYKADEVHVFPQLALQTNLYADDEKLIKSATKNIEEIFEMIKAKGARMNLVVSDCCNSLIQFYRRLTTTTQVTRPPTTGPNRVEMANLFLKRRASILMSAADKGQYAITDKVFGSLFTMQFSTKLMGALWGKANNVTWEYIIAETNTATVNFSKEYNCGTKDAPFACLQQPIFKIE